MSGLRNLSKTVLSKVYNDPEKYLVGIREYGSGKDINEYDLVEITQMYYGIYVKAKRLRVDGNYFIDVRDIKNVGCILDSVTLKAPLKSESNEQSNTISIERIITYYVEGYYVETNEPVNGNTTHFINNHLLNVNFLHKGKTDRIGLYSVGNSYKTLQSFKMHLYPKDLFHGIKVYINGLFWNDQYYNDDFTVESDFNIVRD